MRIVIYNIKALRYKLQMLGICCNLTTSIYCDNKTVTKATTHPEITLNKKHNAICYHRPREAVAMGMIQVAWVEGAENIADLFTKPLRVEWREHLLSNLLY
jgi:hypothetical protein